MTVSVRRSIASGLAVAVLIGGCTLGTRTVEPAIPPEPAVLHVVNVDGPEVEVLLGGLVVATIPCGGTMTLIPGVELPAWPWELLVRATDGGNLDGQTERAISIAGPTVPRSLLVRGRSVLTGPWPISFGPRPGPCASTP
jgi:hypothetical protein